MSAAQSQLLIEGLSQTKTLVLANSLASSLSLWDPALDHFLSSFRVVRFNYYGHGANNQLSRCETVDDMAAALLQQLSAAGIERFSFMGISLGGMLGLYLAAHAQSRVESLVVSNARVNQSQESRAGWQDRIELVSQRGVDCIVEPTIERWLSPSFRARHEDTTQWLRTMAQSTSRDGYVAAASAVRDFDGTTYLQHCSCPALLIAGTCDMAAPPDQAKSAAQTLNANYVELDGAHISSIENQHEFLAATTAFLNKNSDTERV